MKAGRSPRYEALRALLTLLLLLPESPASAAVNCATPGRDGSGSLTGIVNTYWTATATAAAGATTITLGAARGAPAAQTAIAIGDLVLVIQMQDAAINSSNTDAYGDGVAGGTASGYTSLNSSGKYEYVRAQSALALGGGTLTILGANGGGLLNTYTNANATATQGQRRFQVIRVPQYSSATLTSGLTAASWNGSTGGILAVDVSGALDLGGATVSVDGLGFRGGGARQLTGDTGGANTDYVQASAKNFDGAKGESFGGTPGWVYDAGTAATVASGTDYPNQGATIDGGTARGAPANGGGGGTDGQPSANDQNSGGGGGGNGGTGGKGGRSWNTGLDIGGFGGAPFPASATQIVLGGGGGAGTRNNSSGALSSGAAGGGLVLIRVGNVTNAGTISANGATGPVPLNDGGGGGGAGGSIVFTALNGNLAGLTVAARGGAGANAWPTSGPGTGCANTPPGAGCNYHGPGGGGAGGAILLTSAPTSSDVSGGVNGTTTTDANAFGATGGNAGTVVTSILPTTIPGSSSGAECLPTPTPTNTSTNTPTRTNTPTNTPTITLTPSNTPTNTPTITLTPSNTPTQHPDHHVDPEQYAQQHPDDHADPEQHADQYPDHHADPEQHAQQHPDHHVDPEQHADQYPDHHADPEQHADQHADHYADPE